MTYDQEEAAKLRQFTEKNYWEIVEKTFQVANNAGTTPVHPKDKKMKPLVVLPVFPDFDRW